jgi:hypothetical protein
MTDKALEPMREVNRPANVGHVKTKRELDEEKFLKDAIENEEVQENLEHMRGHAHVPPEAR